MQARFFLPTAGVRAAAIRTLAIRSVAVLASVLAVAVSGRTARSAPSANPVAGEFEGERQYKGKDGQVHEIEEPTGKDRGNINRLLGVGKANTKEEQELFERCAHYYVHALTWSENIANLTALRADLKKHLVQAGKTSAAPDLHDQLNRLALKVCGDAADDPRYPLAVRFNCLLMIGELDSKEGTAGSKTVIPLPDARKRLLEVLGEGQQPVELRTAAMVSLLRHVNLWQGIAAEDQNRLAESATAIVGVPLDPRRDSAGSVWLRLRAFEMLRLLSAKGVKVEQPAIAAALSTMLADERIAAWIRCQAAGELAGIEAAQFAPGQAAQDVRAAANLVVAMSASNPFTKFARQAALEKEADENEQARKKGAKKKDADKKKLTEDESDESTDKSPALPLTKTMRETAVRALQTELGRVRLGLMGREPAKRGELPHSTTHGLYAAVDADMQKAITAAVTHIDAMLAELSKLDVKKDILEKEVVAAVALAIENRGLELAETFSKLPAAALDAEPAGEPEKAVVTPAAGGARRPAAGPPAGNAPAGEAAVRP